MTVMRGKCLPTRLNDLASLQLPSTCQKKIEDAIHENRMHYEPWMESAENFPQLVESFKKRGFKYLPSSGKPMFWSETARGTKQSFTMDQKILDKVGKKTMMKRNSRKKY